MPQSKAEGIRSRPSMAFGWLVLIVLDVCLGSVITASCGLDEECGYNSRCTAHQCRCNDGYSSVVEGRNCTHDICGVADCITCSQGAKCTRCVTMVSEETGRCVDACSTEIFIQTTGEFQGLVCAKEQVAVEETDDDVSIAMISIVVVLALAVVAVAIVAIVMALHYRKFQTRENDDSNSLGIEGEMRKTSARDFEEGRDVIANPAAVYTEQQLDVNALLKKEEDSFEYLHAELQPQIPRLDLILQDVQQKRDQLEADMVHYEGVRLANQQKDRLDRLAYDLNSACMILEERMEDIPYDERDAMLLKWARHMLNGNSSFRTQRKSFTSFMPESSTSSNSSWED